jgi:hypothetical protein
MILAVHTSATAASLWVMMIVVVALLAFWLIMVVVAASRPGAGQRRRSGTARVGQYHLAATGPPAGTAEPSSAGIAPKQLAEPQPDATGSDTTEPVASVSDTAPTRDDMYPVPGPRQEGPAPAATSPLERAAGATPTAAGATPTRPPSTEKADMDTSTEEPGVQWTARTPAQRESATDEGARTTPRKDA